MLTPLITRVEGWLYKTVLFLIIKKNMTISLSLSEVGVIYKLTDGKNIHLFSFVHSTVCLAILHLLSINYRPCTMLTSRDTKIGP